MCLIAQSRLQIGVPQRPEWLAQAPRAEMSVDGRTSARAGFFKVNPRAPTGQHLHRAMLTAAEDRGGVAYEYLSEKLTPYPLPTKDAGVLRTIGDASAYIQALSKTRAPRAHWQHAGRLLLQEVRPAVLTAQVQIALFMDGKLDDGAFRHLSSARRWRRHTPAS
jgi:hypothetical protein